MWVSQPGPSQGLYYGGGPDRGPGGMGGPRFSAPPPPLPTSSARELISVPVNNGNHIGVRTDVIYLLYYVDIMIYLCLYAKNCVNHLINENIIDKRNNFGRVEE